MRKISNTTDLQNELRRLLAAARESQPSRSHIAEQLEELAARVAGDRHPFGEDVDTYIKYVREHLASCETALKQGNAKKAKDQLGQVVEWSKAAIRALPNR